ncbi:glucuronate isomerase, partial [Bacillus pumilus]|uniref:glucuronate isomerase n=1 Tax=Bacillus pumilus TaxID=1408 RepID=UPI0011A9973E
PHASHCHKFMPCPNTVPITIPNPLYHSTHLQLTTYFELQHLLNQKNPHTISHKINENLQQEAFPPRHFILKSNLQTLLTTDDPIHSLQYH